MLVLRSWLESDEVEEARVLEDERAPVDHPRRRAVRTHVQQQVEAVYVLHQDFQRGPVDEENVSVLQVLERHPPVHLPVLLREHDLRAVVEELRRHVLLDGRGLAGSHPDKDETFQRAGREAARGTAGPVAELRPRPLAEECDRGALLVEGQPVVRAGQRAREQALAIGHRGVAVRTPVGDRHNLAVLAAEEGQVLAEHPAPHWLAGRARPSRRSPGTSTRTGRSSGSGPAAPARPGGPARRSSRQAA